MIRQALRLALTGALFLAACGESEAERQGLGASPNPLLFEIRGPDGHVDGWLFGTIHALPDGTDWRTDPLEEIIDTADLLIVEVAELEDRGAIAAAFSELATTPNLGPLPPRIEPELHDELAEMIEQSGMESSRFDSTESWAAAIMLSRAGAVGDPRNGVDRTLIHEFADRAVLGLETPREQLAVFDALPPEDQRDLLEGTIREWDEARPDPAHLTKAWLYGDREALNAAATTGIMADPELREALLVGRNRAWMPALLEALESDERPLIAVGTAHILGPDGLTESLAQAGYEIGWVPHYGFWI